MDIQRKPPPLPTLAPPPSLTGVLLEVNHECGLHIEESPESASPAATRILATCYKVVEKRVNDSSALSPPALHSVRLLSTWTGTNESACFNQPAELRRTREW